MRLIHDLQDNESKLIGDVVYTKKTFSTEGWWYYNERHTRPDGWGRFRDLCFSHLPNNHPKSDFWVKVILMKFRGYIYQTIATNFHEDIYEVIGVRQDLESAYEVEYYFRPNKCRLDYLPYEVILKIGYELRDWAEIFGYTGSCPTTLLLRKDIKLALRGRKAFIRHRRNINIQDKRLPLYLNGTYYPKRTCLDDSCIIGAIPYNGNASREIWLVDYPWIDYTTKVSSTSPINEVRYSVRQWCIFPFGGLGLPKVLAIPNKKRDYYYQRKRQTERLIIPLNKRERGIRAQYIKAFREKLYTLEEDCMPWVKHHHKRLRNMLKQRAAGRQKSLRNGKLF